jgi:uncharacterized protein YlxW (UPF0749 family)
MWISKKKYQAEINRVKDEEMWASINRSRQARQFHDIEKLKKDLKKLKKKVKELRNG